MLTPCLQKKYQKVSAFYEKKFVMICDNKKLFKKKKITAFFSMLTKCLQKVSKSIVA
tara:strand:+ start:3896 stop:4066 length:171 start_codon:yes stop_codon:yes gene_type:complete